MIVGCFLLIVSAAEAQDGIITRGEALAIVYPDAEITRDRVILTSQQMTKVARLAQVAMRGKIFPRYTASQNGVVIGRAYVDTHDVKANRQSLLVALNTTGHILRVNVTTFFEPAQYLPPKNWLRQYDKQPLHDDLIVRRGIRPIAGSSFTGRAVNSAVRRVLALDKVLTNTPKN